MKLSIAAVSIVAGSALYAQGSHVVRENVANTSSNSRPQNPGHGDNQHGKSAGAAYFMTNQPEGNFIISCDVGTDGKLTYRNALPTGGKGAHGITPSAPIGPDALFSQGSVRIAGNQVLAVNPGSHTLSVFSFNENDPANLKMVGQPMDTGGEFPVSIAVSKQSGQVCVLNGGKINGINCFKPNNMRQGLVQVKNTNRQVHFNQTTPATGPEGTFSQIMFSENGKQLLVLSKGFPGTSPAMIMTWDVDSRTGELSEKFTPVSGAIIPFSMTMIPGRNAILTTDPGVGFNVWNFKTSSLKSASVMNFPIEGQTDTCWSSFSPKTGNFYLSDLGPGRVTEVHVDHNLKGSVVNQYPQGNGSVTTENFIATVNNKEYLYVLAPGVKSVMVLSLDAPGKTTHIQSFNITDATKSSGITIDRNNLEGMAVFVKGN